MKILVTGGCGFVGSNICLKLKKDNHQVYSLDNLIRKSSKLNYLELKKNNITNFNKDISKKDSLNSLQKFDIIIDCCAEAAVEVSKKDIDRVVYTNLIGTLNILNKVKTDNSKLIFISSSRVNSISQILKFFKKKNLKKKIMIKKKINEQFQTSKPKSIYGFTKHASEMLIEEFSFAFGIQYIINRCGVISGPMQFGKQDQGFVSLWIWHHIIKKNLKYIGFGGHGNQIRDVLHIDDLIELLKKQLKSFKKINNQTFCIGGSTTSFTSLKNLTKLCQKITKNKIKFDKVKETSIYDIPYFITDNSKVLKTYDWKPMRNISEVVNDTYNWLLKNKNKLKKLK
jgi:CDP-paratose 2-epimerase